MLILFPVFVEQFADRHFPRGFCVCVRTYSRHMHVWVVQKRCWCGCGKVGERKDTSSSVTSAVSIVTVIVEFSSHHQSLAQGVTQSSRPNTNAANFILQNTFRRKYVWLLLGLAITMATEHAMCIADTTGSISVRCPWGCTSCVGTRCCSSENWCVYNPTHRHIRNMHAAAAAAAVFGRVEG